MIYYQRFSQAGVFDSAPLNVFFNQLFTGLINVFGQEKVVDNLLLDGKVALLIQEVEVPAKLTTLELSTNDIELFKYLKSNAKMLPIKDHKFSDGRLVLITNINYVVYVNYVDKPMNTFTLKGLIKVRDKNEIV